MDRICYQKLIDWKSSKDRKPLVLLGARQVGKTHLLTMFGEQNFRDVLIINFEENRKIHSIFDQDLNPDKIIEALEIFFETTIEPKHTLIIFDEIQECSRALTSLKYFCEKGKDYFIAAAGSLLGLKVSRNSGFPVGKVKFIHLFPMSFFEFLMAIDKKKLQNHLQKLTSLEPVENAIHEQAMELFRVYTVVGGMPEAVKKYRDTHNFKDVREIQQSILKTYEFDFAKHAETSQIAKITEIWQSIPEQLAKENKKFIFSHISKNARAREYNAAIQWLIDAGIIYQCLNISIPRLPLPAYSEKTAFKIYLLDTGLLGAMSHLSSQVLLNGNNLFKEFKGSLIENIVGQQLIISGQEKLYYWTSGNTAEVDFIVSNEEDCIPIEVKSGSSHRIKSLLVYKEKYKPKIAVRVSPQNLRQNGNLINIPLYLVERFYDLLLGLR